MAAGRRGASRRTPSAPTASSSGRTASRRRSRKINREGARLAREAAAGQRRLVAGAIGPLGKPLAPLGNVARRRGARGLARAGRGPGRGRGRPVPARDDALARPGAGRARGRALGERELPVARRLTFNEEGNDHLRRPARGRGGASSRRAGVAVVGANCSQGPQAMLDTVQRMAAVAQHREALGHAERRRARARRRAATSTSARPSTWRPTARRFLEAGATRGRRLLRHDARAHHATWCARCAWSSRVAGRGAGRCPRSAPREAPAPGAARGEVARSRASSAASSWSASSSTRPRGADPGAIIERAQYCKENEVDAINVADGPRASARMSAQALCVLLQQKVGIDTILHYTCRDRNLLGIQSDLLGAHALGLRNILAHHRRPAQARRLPGRDRRLRRRLDRPDPHPRPPQPRLRPRRQPDRPARSASTSAAAPTRASRTSSKEVRRLEEKVEGRAPSTS